MGVEVNWIGDKQLPEALPVYFLIEQHEPFRYKMLDISFTRQEGCPGESFPPEDTLSLFPKQTR